MIGAEQAEKHLSELIEGLPAHMEDERVLLEIVKNAVLNHLMWAYNNKPYDKHNHERWQALSEVLSRYGE
jgi:hypothetical protein